MATWSRRVGSSGSRKVGAVARVAWTPGGVAAMPRRVVGLNWPEGSTVEGVGLTRNFCESLTCGLVRPIVLEIVPLRAWPLPSRNSTEVGRFMVRLATSRRSASGSRYDEELSTILSEFARTVITDFPVQGVLDRFVERIVEVMPITSAGVTLISAGTAPHCIAVVG